MPNLLVRYLTNGFHAKIYIFNNSVPLGSSNLTDDGLYSDWEAVICLDQLEDSEAIMEIRAVFRDLWEVGQVLTTATLNCFAKAHQQIS